MTSMGHQCYMLSNIITRIVKKQFKKAFSLTVKEI